MNRLLWMACISLCVMSCQKQLPDAINGNIAHENLAMLDPSLGPPFHVTSMAADAPYYSTRQIAEYTRIRQAVEYLPSVSYRYAPVQRYVTNEAGYTTMQPDIIIDREMQDQRKALNVTEYLKCFAAIVDNQYASCEMEIFTDIPVDNDAASIFDFADGYPGHVFLQLRKSNGVQKVTRTLGFYPAEGWKTLISDGAVAAKFVDNSAHEYNAAYNMKVTTAQLSQVIGYLSTLARVSKYDIDDFNCTDLALAVFNKVRPGDPVRILKTSFADIAKPLSTPQGLYRELQRRTRKKPPDPAVRIVAKKTYASANTGTCN